MANFSYKEVKTTTLKVAGILDVDRGTIEVDGVEKRLSLSYPILIMNV